MKKILLIIALFLSFSGIGQLSVNSKLVHYFSDIHSDKFTTFGADLTINFVMIDSQKTVFIIDNFFGDTLCYTLKEQKLLPQLEANLAFIAFECIERKDPSLLLLISFVFNKKTEQLYSIGVCDGIIMKIYDIDYSKLNKDYEK